jgi:hypothetical protein
LFRRVAVIATTNFITIEQIIPQDLHQYPSRLYMMTRTKRGAFQGGARGGFKKATTKRAASDDEDDAPRATKKAKSDESEGSVPVVPELEEDDQGDAYISVRIRCSNAPKVKLTCEAQYKRQATRHDQ